MCACGCRGWCTIWPVLQVISWSLRACRAGVHPATRWDGSAWGAADGFRAWSAGLPLSCRAALIHLKGDWAEYAHTLGFPTGSSTRFPCLFCRATKSTLLEHTGLSRTSFPHDLLSAEDYEQACLNCEVRVHIESEAERATIAEALHYDRRKDGAHGRALTRRLPRWGLERNDRLEPSEELRDVGDFESLAVPTTVLFWRTRAETRTRHRNPLLPAWGYPWRTAPWTCCTLSTWDLSWTLCPSPSGSS
eukprot:5879819-Alexandrium_andersonii.AAC.1